ncbi:MAG: NUDIX hydrolase [Rhodobiaceae bacterium]|nr:NUDIX hydrolase [Rhodobiaceae bacterium]MCC0015356.1 NUDIX hydrolase [Rhodobiaceae bacterium]MCC0042003.1 NUDIX hydrolase [Rhodobiaceae bacterium]MCC0053405.1 NUDIX hydrolase [Rhodobiaceae bacterium]
MPKRLKEQVAALPVLVGPDGLLRVMLITSRDTGRWIIPKGWKMRGHEDWDAAALEAFEEAGLEGDVKSTPIGHFSYDKILDGGKSMPCRVAVYRLDVKRWTENWPERGERERLWCLPDEAAERLQEPELKELVRKLARKSASRRGKAAA